MRSLIILEVEHGEDTDALNFIIADIKEAMPHITALTGAVVNDYTVRVDLPACFTLDKKE